MSANDDSNVSHLLLRHISVAGGGALYQQIIDAIKREISEGRLKPGAPMPSFRSLARDLMVSLITVKRAYEELEREGILRLHQGLGTFVSENGSDASRRAKMQRAAELMMEAAREAREAGQSSEQIRQMLDQIIRKEGRRR